MYRRLSAPLADFIPPQLARLADSTPESEAWLPEVKIEGYRVAARIDRGEVEMLTRHANDLRLRPIRRSPLRSQGQCLRCEARRGLVEYAGDGES
jgi:hypothetical protein